MNMLFVTLKKWGLRPTQGTLQSYSRLSLLAPVSSHLVGTAPAGWQTCSTSIPIRQRSKLLTPIERLLFN